MPKEKPWYAAGLRFECQRCSGCCRGEPGYVWVGPDEIQRMAESLGLSPGEFIAAYVRSVGDRQSLKELPGGDCVLWGGTERGCIVYAERPIQCQTFPFWRENIRSPRAWAALADHCPGVNRGPMHTLKHISKNLNRRH